MPIVNYNTPGGPSRQLYRIRYCRPFADPDPEVYFLATGVEDVIAMFVPFYLTGDRDPRTFKAEPTSIEIAEAQRQVRAVERVADVVIGRERHR